MRRMMMLPVALATGLGLAGETVVQNGVAVACSDTSREAISLDTRTCAKASANGAKSIDSRTRVSAESAPVPVNSDKKTGSVFIVM